MSAAVPAAHASGSELATQGRHQGKIVYPMRGAHTTKPAATAATGAPADLVYGGGTDGIGVTTGTPRVYLVFWGSQWATQGTDGSGNATFSGDPSGVAVRLQQLFKGIGTAGETWSGVMTQYCEGIPSGSETCSSDLPHVGYPYGGAFAGVWADESLVAPSKASEHALAAEAVKAASHFGN